MKKQVLKSFLLLAIVGSASTAMAVTSIVGQVTIGAGNTFTPSAKVGIRIISGPLSYAAQSCHINGTKEYGTTGGTGSAKDVSKIYSKNIPDQASNTTGVGIPGDPADATDLASGTWD
jgi:hypothetical protein